MIAHQSDEQTNAVDATNDQDFSVNNGATRMSEANTVPDGLPEESVVMRLTEGAVPRNPDRYADLLHCPCGHDAGVVPDNSYGSCIIACSVDGCDRSEPVVDYVWNLTEGIEHWNRARQPNNTASPRDGDSEFA